MRWTSFTRQRPSPKGTQTRTNIVQAGHDWEKGLPDDDLHYQGVLKTADIMGIERPAKGEQRARAIALLLGNHRNRGNT